MGHKTLIGGTAYDIKGGKVLINGEIKDIKGGKVLIGGVVRDIKFGTPISDLAEGALVYMNESGSPVQFYVAKHDYESGLNGAGRTLFVRKEINIKYYPWNLDSNAHNGYENCTMDTWFTSTYLNTLDAGIQTLIGTTKIPCVRGKNKEAYTLGRSVFALSYTEYGLTGIAAAAATEGTTLPIASTLRDDTKTLYPWTRSLDMEYPTSNAWYAKGNVGTMNQFSTNRYYRPAFTLPSDTLVDDDYNTMM